MSLTQKGSQDFSTWQVQGSKEQQEMENPTAHILFKSPVGNVCIVPLAKGSQIAKSQVKVGGNYPSVLIQEG